MLSGLSYNIYHGRNLDQITTWLNSLSSSFDILCFQEFPYSYIPYLQDHLKPSHYDFHYATSFKHGEDDYGELTLTDRMKISLVEHSIVPLGTSFIEEKLLRLQSGRSALLTKLVYDKKSFLLVNTHLLAYASNEKRREQLSAVMQSVRHYTEKEAMPVVVLGDMNYTSLLNRDKLFDLIKSNGFTNAYKEHTHKLISIKYHQLDYIFFKDCSIQNVRVLKQPFSDHLPITFSLNI